jgi:hypothetical protein
MSYKKINKLCQYDSPPSKEVTIDGVVVTIRDPATPTAACQFDAGYFTEDNSIDLTGNNQLLTFGIFLSGRALKVMVISSVL